MSRFRVEVETDVGGSIEFSNIQAEDATEAQGIALANSGPGKIVHTEQVDD